jgi:RNA recognition motif-containing protein
MLAQFMQQAGDVKSAQVIRYPDGRSKGWGLVEFAYAEGAADAISNYNDFELMGRKIFIREDRENGEPGGLPAPGGGGVGGFAAGGKGGKGAGAGGKGGRSGRSRARPPLPEPETEPQSGTALFVGNLPWSTTSQQLKEVFSEYNVKTAEIKAGYDGRSRGYGIVSFDTEEDAASALALGGYNLDGREMLVRFDRQLGDPQ